MPRKKKEKPQLQVRKPLEDSADLEDFVREANEVEALAKTTGWSILVRDLTEYRSGIGVKLAYISPKRVEFDEARILYCAVDKLFALVDDYRSNRQIAIDTLNKIQNPDLAVAMDVDSE